MSQALPDRRRGPPGYAELHCLSHFSFLRGASAPDELLERAQALGYRALALTDECSLAGVVRAHVALKRLVAELRQSRPDLDPELDIVQLIMGSEFMLQAWGSDGTDNDGAANCSRIVLLAPNRRAYGQISSFITRLRRESAHKGRYRLDWPLLLEALHQGALRDCLGLLVLPRLQPDSLLLEQAQAFARGMPSGQAWLGVTLLHELSDKGWLERLRSLSRQCGLPLTACGDVHYHRRSLKPLQDILTATRLNRPLAECGWALQPNAERHLRSRLRLSQIYPAELLAETLHIAARCHFSLDELRYQYPSELVPPGKTAFQHLHTLTQEGMDQRWPGGAPTRWQAQVAHELTLIEELGYEHYFLTVADVVRFARAQGILCQGRGSAANSVVCYCLHITAVDPERSHLLFERFISRERREPPDIDVDFEHERREEVIQYLYRKYGRDRAALTAVVIRYRPRSALRDVGRALGLAEEHIQQISRLHGLWSDEVLGPEQEAELQQQLTASNSSTLLNLDTRLIQQWLDLARQLMGTPRHLSQHVGGFVLTQSPLHELVPIENASMPGRTVIEWDKDDLDAMNWLKVDVLALGMLSALRRCLDLVNTQRGTQLCLASIPAEDPATYDMICAADTVGTFQIESRAQMSMLPRLRPRTFYDLVIEVAIVRPGPIQGGMVHPYLENRRKSAEQIVYPSEALKVALERTRGVPIFQEQVMQVAMIAAGFTAGEADQLRRAMAAWKRPGDLARFHERILKGMRERGYTEDFAESIFRQIQGFASYGFPESHAASFALLTYVSCWLKCHEPAAFLCALLNSQPLGFYTPGQLIQDARRHGIEVLPADVSHSEVDATLCPRTGPQHLPRDGALPCPSTDAGDQGSAGAANTPTHTLRSSKAGAAPPTPRPASHRLQSAVRLGLRTIAGLSRDSAERITRARQGHPFVDVEDLSLRAELSRTDMQLLAAADALRSLSGHRRQQVWQASAMNLPPPLLRPSRSNESLITLAPADESEEVLWDYAATGLSLRKHPLALLRPLLRQQGWQSSADLLQRNHRQTVKTCGLVTVRQRPQTAKGTMFLSLEDEHGNTQVIVWPDHQAAHRHTLRASRLLGVCGQWQRSHEGVCHLLGTQFTDLTPLLGEFGAKTKSRDFR